jgi:hypothetical protein
MENFNRAIELYFKNGTPSAKEAKLMKEIEIETEKELKELNFSTRKINEVLYNKRCLNNSASHVCGAGGSPCEF